MIIFIVYYEYYGTETVYAITDSEEKAKEYCDKYNANFTEYQLKNTKKFYYEDLELNKFLELNQDTI